MADYKKIIKVKGGKKAKTAFVRNLQITVNDVLSWLISGMSIEQILKKHKDLTRDDILAVLEYGSNLPEPAQ